jgi:hypothetical protein
MIHTILLLPSDGDPHGLLRPGVCGARPPTLLLCRADERVPSRAGDSWHIAGPPCREHPRERALVLYHDGAVVPEGLDRARRCLGIYWWAYDVERRIARWAAGDFGARYLLDPRAGCTVVALDAEGREVPRG